MKNNQQIDNNTNKWKINYGYGWIDHVTIEDIDCIVIDNESVTMYKNGIEVCNAFKGYVDEVGFCEYNKNDNLTNTSKKIVYQY